MEAIEFYVWEGKVRYRLDGEERILKQNDREIIEFVLETLRTFFPEALNAISEECNDSSANKLYYDFRRVDLFIRCNFAEHDTLNFDVANGFMHFEEVKCPRRGICKNEGKICKPKMKMSITKEERQVAILYSKGLTAVDISTLLKKSLKTVKNQLTSVTKRLKLSRTRDIIKVFSVYNGYTIWE